LLDVLPRVGMFDILEGEDTESRMRWRGIDIGRWMGYSIWRRSGEISRNGWNILEILDGVDICAFPMRVIRDEWTGDCWKDLLAGVWKIMVWGRRTGYLWCMEYEEGGVKVEE